MEKIIAKNLIKVFASHATSRKLVSTKDIIIGVQKYDLRFSTNFCIF